MCHERREGSDTGARVSELTALRVRDVLLDRQSAVHLHGKGRKQRAMPLWKNTAAELQGFRAPGLQGSRHS